MTTFAPIDARSLARSGDLLAGHGSACATVLPAVCLSAAPRPE